MFAKNIFRKNAALGVADADDEAAILDATSKRLRPLRPPLLRSNNSRSRNRLLL